MTYQETFPSPPADFGDEAEHAVRQYDALIEESKTAIQSHTVAAERHKAAAREETEKCELLIAHREEAVSLVGLQARLRAMHESAREHGIFIPAPPAPAVELRIVPSPHDGGTTSPADAEPAPSGEPTAPPSTDTEQLPAQIVIRSQKQQEILNVIAQRPEEPWGSEALARTLGIPRDPRERKSLRNCLRALTISGALERVTREDDPHVYYRPRLNWKFA
ncbi:hypothetical protein [Streptomyces sp. B21-083]|uniref:hypothetical protein n=1 Tax=Streptomyces sp. B21-083 TaxID=3039410 RepID=UPI002FF1083D